MIRIQYRALSISASPPLTICMISWINAALLYLLFSKRFTLNKVQPSFGILLFCIMTETEYATLYPNVKLL